jgi:predicted transcriptional regulator
VTRKPGRSPFTFDPRKRGLRKVLGELEAEVMEHVWKSGEVSVRDVYETVGKRRDLAYTTVMTVMSRLAGKDLLRRRAAGGQAWLYSPTTTRDEFTTKAIGTVLAGLLSDFGNPSLSQFVELIGGDSEERMEELARLVEEKRKKRK